MILGICSIVFNIYNTCKKVYAMQNIYKGLITLCVVSLAFFILPHVFHFTSRFFLAFRYHCVGIQNASENARKMLEKREENPKREPNGRKYFYITLCIGQKRKSVAFCSHFASVLLTNFTKTQTQRIVQYGHKTC